MFVYIRGNHHSISPTDNCNGSMTSTNKVFVVVLAVLEETTANGTSQAQGTHQWQ